MSTGQDSVVLSLSLEDAITLIVIPPSDETTQLVKITSAITPSHGYTVPGYYARLSSGDFELIGGGVDIDSVIPLFEQTDDVAQTGMGNNILYSNVIGAGQGLSAQRDKLVLEYSLNINPTIA